MLDEFALLGLAGDDGFAFERDFAIVEAELGFAVVFVMSVTDKTVFGKNGANIAIELDFVRCACRGGNAQHKQGERRHLAISGQHIQGKIQTRITGCIFARTLVVNAMNDTVTAINLTK